MKRLDTSDKLDGSKVYAIDVKLPGMLCAAIKDAPVYGSKVVSYDESKIAGRPGVRRGVKVGEAGGPDVSASHTSARRLPHTAGNKKRPHAICRLLPAQKIG